MGKRPDLGLLVRSIRNLKLFDGSQGIEQLRKRFERQMTKSKSSRVESGEVTIVPVAHRKFGGEIVKPQQAQHERSILYLHGGGFVAGSAVTHRQLTAALAVQCQAQVLSLDYRLAPEFPFPAALEDAYAGHLNLCHRH